MTVTACSSGPSRIEGPDVDADDAGQAAVEQYDTDGDGLIQGAELDQAPPIKAAIARIDQDSDGAASADEIAARVEVWQAAQTGLTGFKAYVTLNGQPLDGATVTYEPEPFMGGGVKTATAVTNAYGYASPVIPKEERPTPTSPGGITYGFYRVKISRERDGKELIPARYNSETSLGHEVAPDDEGVRNMKVEYKLTTK